MKIILIFIGFVFIVPITFAQTIEGYVFNKADSSAIQGASVYFDGTSVGVSTNKNGYFKIPAQETTTPLIISSLGYKILISSNYIKRNNSFYLLEETEELDAVVLETDPWSRAKKLDIFRKEFLGKLPGSRKCKIKNEEVLSLSYSPSTETLTAYSHVPLVIINRYLGYKLQYNLQNFLVQYTTGTSGLQITKYVYYEGFSFFKNLRKKTRKKIIKNRKEAYLGSGLHFMRSLKAQLIAEENFRIFKGNYEVLPYSYFKLNEEDELTKISILSEDLSILYNQFDQSGIMAEEDFYIDNFGNHTPPHALMFSGEIGKNRIGQLLPLNYQN